jgi:hypothetical protein
MRIKIKCKICKNIFYDFSCNNRKFCSKPCADRGRSIQLIGKSLPWMVGRKPWNKGKKFPQYSGVNNPSWKGGKYKNEGYVYIFNPEHPLVKKNGYVAEHRLVLEKEIGRIITKTESIHHINKRRDDNRIENLMLLKNRKSHIRIDLGLLIPYSDIVFPNTQKRRF